MKSSDFLIPDADDLMESQNAVTVQFNNDMQAETSNARQVELAESWKIGNKISAKNLKLIIDTLTFKDDFHDILLGMDVIDNVTYFSETDVGISGTNIEGPKLKVNFKDGYASTKDVIIQVGSLGMAK
ncbi:MAG: hypothetical protein ACRC8C_01700 [Mycoplasmoidaceae bacterium]